MPYLKSLLQKLIRQRSTYVAEGELPWSFSFSVPSSGDDAKFKVKVKFRTPVVILVCLARMFMNRGGYLPNVHKVVSGAAHALKRTVVTICEDSAIPSDMTPICASVMCAAAIANAHPEWSPSILILRQCFRLALAGWRSRHVYQTRSGAAGAAASKKKEDIQVPTKWLESATTEGEGGIQSSMHWFMYMCLASIGSFPSDVKLFGSIALCKGRQQRQQSILDMDRKEEKKDTLHEDEDADADAGSAKSILYFHQPYDHHVSSNFLHMMTMMVDSSEWHTYREVVKDMWDLVSSYNPRVHPLLLRLPRKVAKKNNKRASLDVAQRIAFHAWRYTPSPPPSMVVAANGSSPSYYLCSHSLSPWWATGLLGPIHVTLNANAGREQTLSSRRRRSSTKREAMVVLQSDGVSLLAGLRPTQHAPKKFEPLTESEQSEAIDLAMKKLAKGIEMKLSTMPVYLRSHFQGARIVMMMKGTEPMEGNASEEEDSDSEDPRHERKEEKKDSPSNRKRKLPATTPLSTVQPAKKRSRTMIVIDSSDDDDEDDNDGKQEKKKKKKTKQEHGSGLAEMMDRKLYVQMPGAVEALPWEQAATLQYRFTIREDALPKQLDVASASSTSSSFGSILGYALSISTASSSDEPLWVVANADALLEEWISRVLLLFSSPSSSLVSSSSFHVSVLTKTAHLLYHAADLIEMSDIDRKGKGPVDGRVETGCYQLLVRLACLYPAALSMIPHQLNQFRVKCAPLLWQLAHFLVKSVARYSSNPSGAIGQHQHHHHIAHPRPPQGWRVATDISVPAEPWPHQLAARAVAHQCDLNRPQTFRHVSVVPGEPGTGKTRSVFLYFLDRIKAGTMLPMCIWATQSGCLPGLMNEAKIMGLATHLMDMRKSAVVPVTTKNAIQSSKALDRMELKPYCINIIQHDHLRLGGRFMEQVAPYLEAHQVMFVCDEVHLALSSSIRTQLVMKMFRECERGIAISGTLVKNEDFNALFHLLGMVVPFPVTLHNMFSAVGSLLSCKLDLGIHVKHEVVNAEMSAGEAKQYQQLIREMRDPTVSCAAWVRHTNFKCALQLCYSACTRRMVAELGGLLKRGHRVFIIAINSAHQAELRDQILLKCKDFMIHSKEIHCITKDLPLDLGGDPSIMGSPESMIRVVITIPRFSVGYNMSSMTALLETVWFSNQNTRSQMYARVRRKNQVVLRAPKPEDRCIHHVTVQAGLLESIRLRYDRIANLEQAIQSFARSISLENCSM